MLVLWEGPEEAPGGPGMGGHGTSAEPSARQDQEDKWLPITKLGCLVKDMKIKSLEEIYLFSLLSRNLRSLTFSWEHPLIKQTCADQVQGICHHRDLLRSMSVWTSTEAATAIRGAIILAKLSIIPHMGPCRVTGRCGSVLVCLTPAPRYHLSPSAQEAPEDVSPTTASPLLGAALSPWATSPRPFLTPFPRLTVISSLISGKRLVSVQRTQAPAVATT
ncbi:hypothetical protein FD755_006239 [Muntiacus reevesi]|uniref:Uncharacterized protein n=1 Tax=Muntiacus reevesi TaxID=9886 RepID=A0A5J5MY39_MUNRE|nr:hypothetical protein FD755_006239 [Muntiacus reevesi]